MPEFTPDDLSITPYDFLDSCRETEINRVIEWLKDNEYINEDDDDDSTDIETNVGLPEYFFKEYLDKIKENYYSLSAKDEEILIRIGKKFI